MNVGQRVVLKWYPFCTGTIVVILKPLKVGEITVSNKYVVKWDVVEYGKSDWLTDNDLLKIAEGENA